MEFKFPKPETTTVPTVPLNKLMACTAFNEATGAGSGSAAASYNASFEDKDQISVLTLARWIRAYYEDQNVKP
jgi:hypothetical protein